MGKELTFLLSITVVMFVFTGVLIVAGTIHGSQVTKRLTACVTHGGSWKDETCTIQAKP